MRHTFFVHFFAVTARLRRERLNLTFQWGTWHKTTAFFFFSWTSIQPFSKIQLQINLPIFARIERVIISAGRFEAGRIHFLSDAFVAVAVVVKLLEAPSSFPTVEPGPYQIQHCLEWTSTCVHLPKATTFPKREKMFSVKALNWTLS